jgi:hypothetical protein
MNTIFGASAVTLLYSMVIPGILSTGVKWYILKKDTGKGSNVLSSMLYNQLSTTVVIMVVGLIALIATRPTGLVSAGENRWLLPVVAVACTGTILMYVLLLNGRTGGGMIQAMEFLLRPLPDKIRRAGGRVLEQLSGFQSAGFGFHAAAALFTVAGMGGGGVLLYFFAAKAANVMVPIGVLVWLWAVVYILGRLPISIANLGVREVTVAGCLSLYGVESPKALLMSMVLFSAILFMAVIGATYQVFWAVRRKKSGSAVG